jgi:outer membrane protein assembly factor BamB
MRIKLTNLVLCSVLAVSLCLGFPATASPRSPAVGPAALSLKPAIGPPTTPTRARGTGYLPGEKVAVSFDGGAAVLAVADANGTFSKRISVPAAALPGAHTVTAVGRSSQLDVSAVFVVRTDWLQACSDAGRSCFNPYENTLPPGAVGALALRWRAAVATDGRSSPVYANGLIFAGTAGGLVGLDPATGAIIVDDRAGPVVTTPAVIHGFDPQPDPPGKVIFATSDGVLHAVTTAGAALWHVALGTAPGAPLVLQTPGSGSAEVIVGAGRTLYALDQGGHRRWAVALEGGDVSQPPAALVSPSDPTRLLVAAGNTLHELDAATGAVIWSHVLSRGTLGAPAVGDPTIIGDPHILVGDTSGSLYSLDPATGTLLATFAARGPITGSPAIGDPHIAGPWVLVGDVAGNIYAIDRTDDLPPPIWQATLGGPVDGPPALAQGVVYASTDPQVGTPDLVALDQASGRVLFRAALPAGAAAGPIVADGRVIVATRDGTLLAYQRPGS